MKLLWRKLSHRICNHVCMQGIDNLMNLFKYVTAMVDGGDALAEELAGLNLDAPAVDPLGEAIGREPLARGRQTYDATSATVDVMTALSDRLHVNLSREQAFDVKDKAVMLFSQQKKKERSERRTRTANVASVDEYFNSSK